MEKSTTPLTFKGSITEAVMESKRQKKLFVVYISGEDEISRRMEETTWIDRKVAESVLKYCILLHIAQGSPEASQFSAIYPQTAVPCITVVGYNGVQIWQNDGFVAAETLQSTIEKAWLSLHLQETTASILTAALASKISGPSSSGTSIDGLQKDVGIIKDRQTTDSVVVDKELHHKSEVEKSTESDDRVQVDDRGDLPSSSSLETVEESPTFSENGTIRSVEEKSVLTEDMKMVNHDQCSDGCEGTSTIVSRELSGHNATEDTKTEGNTKVYVPDSDDVNLNIRLSNGTSLQKKFHLTSTLREVKAYVNENQTSMGSFDLAIPYPRRVFSDQDLSQSLLELGLSNRQALIVVPRRQASGEPRAVNIKREKSPMTAGTSSNANEEGYLSYIVRVLSYFNPLAYIGRGPSSSTSSQMGSEGRMRHYGVNPGLQNSIREAGSQDQPKPEASNSIRKNKQPANTRFGSNIHTLKHDDEDGRFDNRNPFWNGNSTQYNGNGGNEDSK